jgi:hypothetical protein
LINSVAGPNLDSDSGNFQRIIQYFVTQDSNWIPETP